MPNPPQQTQRWLHARRAPATFRRRRAPCFDNNANKSSRPNICPTNGRDGRPKASLWVGPAASSVATAAVRSKAAVSTLKLCDRPKASVGHPGDGAAGRPTNQPRHGPDCVRRRPWRATVEDAVNAARPRCDPYCPDTGSFGPRRRRRRGGRSVWSATAVPSAPGLPPSACVSLRSSWHRTYPCRSASARTAANLYRTACVRPENRPRSDRGVVALVL